MSSEVARRTQAMRGSRLAPNLCGDFLNQLLHVGRSTRRLLAMQDQDPCSPAFGCFHYAYWRDKTSDFPDARFQEAGAALGLLSLQCFDSLRDSEGWPSRQTLLAAFRAGLLNLARQQYPEGCYDEWYKGERGFASTAFTTVAFGLAGVLLGPHIDASDKELLVATLTRSARWLARREDLVKTNHEIAGAAALAAVWKLTGDGCWRSAASQKLDLSLANRSPHGWFFELGGIDLGYSSLALDYLMIYHWLTGDERAAAAAGELLELLAPHLHPDLTTAPEAGICHNPYVGQLGFLLLPDQPLASAIVSALSGLPDSSRRISAYLDDDLRLARWAHLPIVASLLANDAAATAASDESHPWFPAGWTVDKAAGLATYHRDDLHIYAAIAGGAVTRIYRGSTLALEDFGLHVREGDAVFAARDYEPRRPLSVTDDGFSMSGSLGRVHYLFPSFSQRLVLRLGSMTPTSSRLTRSLIDRYRVAHRTAGNQSAASMAKGGGRFTLERQLKINGDSVSIIDRLRDRDHALSSETVTLELSVCGVPARLPPTTFRDASVLEVVKVFHAGATPPTLRVELVHA